MAERHPIEHPAEAMLRIGVTMGVPTVLRDLGFSPREVLSEAGFDMGLFEDADNTISYSARGRLMSHCVAKTGCPHFGLLVGQQAGLHSLGLVGLLVRYSPDVITALNNLVRYFHLHVHGAAISLELTGSTAVLGYQIHQLKAPAKDQVGDGAVAALANAVRELCGSGWQPEEIWFMHRKPQDTKPYRRIFRAPLHFDAEQYAVVFKSSWLKRSLPEEYAAVRELVQKQIDLLATRHVDDFPEQVRTVLRAALFSGDIHADRVATLLSMHPRTLNRRLHPYGVRYRDLVEEVRFEIAQQMLQDSDLDISQIALRLNYADARAFIRAFRRWSGETPAHWRAQQKHLASRAIRR